MDKNVPSPEKSKHLASLSLCQVQDFASFPSSGEEILYMVEASSYRRIAHPV